MASAFHSDINHLAECPEISPVHCAAEEIPAHEHQQTLLFINANTSVLWSVAHNWQVGLMVPLLIRELGITYALVDEEGIPTGETFTPSYAGLHHRDETLVGLGDLELNGQYYWNNNSWSFAFSAGSSIPLGKTEEDPYALAAESQVHQHFQLGTGVFSPLVSVNVTRRLGKSGVLLRGEARLSVYENSKGFKPGHIFGGTLGGWHRISPTLTTLFGSTAQHDQADRWFDLRAPYSGQQTVGLNAALMWRVQPQLELLIRLDQGVYEDSLTSDLANEGDAAPLRSMLTVGMTWL